MRRLLSNNNNVSLFVVASARKRRQQHATVSIILRQRQWSSSRRQPLQTNNNIPSLFLLQRNFFHSSSFVVQRSTDSVGLYSIPELQQPTDFFKLTKQAILDSDTLRRALNDDPNSTGDAIDTLQELDEISRNVCNVIDAAELCRSTHASQEWRIAASESFDQLQSYIANLNSDEKLYNSLKNISERSDFNQLHEEQQRFCILLKREFELDGIHLPYEKRQYVQELHHRVNQLETLFAQNITNAVKPFTLKSKDIESVLSRQVLEMNGAKYIQPSIEDGNNNNEQRQEEVVQIYADTPITHSLLSYANNPQLRRHVHMETTTKCPENLDVLDALIKSRHELAVQLGFDSYAERFLQDKMVGTTQGVQNFLKQLETDIQPQFYKELQLIHSAKNHIEGPSEAVEPWDIKFYVKLIKAQGMMESSSPQELMKYWSLSNSIEALQLLSKELFGIEMKDETENIGINERWDIADDNSSKQKPNNSGGIRKFTFWEIQENGDGRPLGTMYLDLYPRPGKYTHAAHFTVRCGCQTIIRGDRDNISNSSSSVNDDNYQLPIVALVCNMNAQGAGQITHQEVETLFHEFGHALHSLLSRTSFQHLSGTRGAMDFVETPSHLIENFVWDRDFLKLILARDVHTGNPMPDDKIDALVKSRNAFRCLEVQNQILLSMFDQQIFGSSSGGINNNNINTLEIWESLHRQHNVPYAKGTHWYSNVGHLVTYGAGYYGYLYSQVFANDIWQKLFQNSSGSGVKEGTTATNIGCLNPNSGEKVWKQVLIHGGSRDPNLMLTDLLGKKPTVENYWKSLV